MLSLLQTGKNENEFFKLLNQQRNCLQNSKTKFERCENVLQVSVAAVWASFSCCVHIFQSNSDDSKQKSEELINKSFHCVYSFPCSRTSFLQSWFLMVIKNSLKLNFSRESNFHTIWIFFSLSACFPAEAYQLFDLENSIHSCSWGSLAMLFSFHFHISLILCLRWEQTFSV